MDLNIPTLTSRMSSLASPRDAGEVNPTDGDEMHMFKTILRKRGEDRSFDDILFLKNYMYNLEYLRNALQRLSPMQQDEFCRCITLEHFYEGIPIFHQGDLADKLYGESQIILHLAVLIILFVAAVILQGNCTVKLRVTTSDGAGEVITITYGPGQQFGDRALEYDEPRGATVTSETESFLIVITITTYNKILKQAVHHESSDTNDSSKVNIHQILSKNRKHRTRSELASVVASVGKKIEFLQQFSYDEQIELFRVCDFVAFWGKNTLFKQGTVGQAFYIVLTGYVDVYVNKTDFHENLVEVHVAQIKEGQSFGEKALESSDSLRAATCVTCDSKTELLVISKAEYERLIAIVRQVNFRERVCLLRKTHCFQSAELSNLTALATIMEPRQWRVNSLVHISGETCTYLSILQTGEFNIKSEVRLGDGSTKVLDFGRVGPGAVMGEYCLMSELIGDEVS